ncbi:hypothetical protein HDU85_000864 [Gaertneriomyces sp. JEL0708]|nr:hypothetical protein HDU85_000864 [Gaertneriomyces sp. JEL0708]
MVALSVVGVAMLSLVAVVVAQPDSADCVMNPSRMSCKGFQLEDRMVNDMVKDICSEVRGVGCTIRKYCTTDEGICSPFSILTTLCAESPVARGCRTYASLCPRTSLVDQCRINPVQIPFTADIEAALEKICQDTQSDACLKTDTDVIEKWRDVCVAKDWPEGCELLNAFCRDHRQTTISQELCPPPPPPPANPFPPKSPATAKGYLHFLPSDTFLVPTWELRSWPGLFSASGFAIAAGIGYAAVIGARQRREAFWLRQGDSEDEDDTVRSQLPIPGSSRRSSVASATGPTRRIFGRASESPERSTLLPIGAGASNKSTFCNVVKRGEYALWGVVEGLVGSTLILMVVTGNVLLIAGVVTGIGVGRGLFSA